MFKDLTPEHFTKLGAALFNTGNLVLAGTLLGQISNISAGNSLDMRIALGGILAWSWCFYQGLVFMEMGEKRRKQQEAQKKR